MATWLAVLATLMAPTAFPNLHLTFFAPSLCLAASRTPLPRLLWQALAFGTLCDLLSGYSHLGVHAISYCAAVWTTFRLKRWILGEEIMTVPILVFAFSVVMRSVLLFQVSVFDHPLHLRFGAWFSSVIGWGVCDGIFAALCLSVPYALGMRRPHVSERYQRQRPS